MYVYFLQILLLTLTHLVNQPSPLVCCSISQLQPHFLQACVCLAVGRVEGVSFQCGLFLVSVSIACAGCGQCSVPICEIGFNPVQSRNPIFVCLF